MGERQKWRRTRWPVWNVHFLFLVERDGRGDVSRCFGRELSKTVEKGTLLILCRQAAANETCKRRFLSKGRNASAYLVLRI